MMKKLCFLASLVIALYASFPAHAGEPRLVGTFKKWSAYVFNEDNNEVCYMAAKPDNEVGDYTKRGEIFALVTHRPGEGTKNVFSYIAGYSYKPGTDATLDIDGTKFSLFTQDDTAWAPDAETDQKIVDSIRKGSKMNVKGTSSRGTATSDDFSLDGSAGAHKKITEECY
jgi:hypothetical protein